MLDNQSGNVYLIVSQRVKLEFKVALQRRWLLWALWRVLSKATSNYVESSVFVHPTETLILEYSNQCCTEENFIPQYVIKKNKDENEL